MGIASAIASGQGESCLALVHFPALTLGRGSGDRERGLIGKTQVALATRPRSLFHLSRANGLWVEGRKPLL